MMGTIVYTGCYQEPYWTSVFGEPDIQGHGEGVSWRKLDTTNGKLGTSEQVGGLINPAALCTSPDGRFLFAASDTRDFINYQHSSGGGVYAFRVNAGGSLVSTDQRSSCGVRAVNLCCDRTGKYLLVVNTGSIFCTTEYLRREDGKYHPQVHYDDGCIVLFRIGENGTFEQVCDRYILPEGNPAHPYTAVFDEDDNLFVTNGSGSISVLRLNRDSERLLPVSTYKIPNGAPRALVRHPQKSMFFCGDYANGCVESLAFNTLNNELEMLFTITMTPKKSDDDEHHAGSLAISPDGRYLYASSYDHAEISVFKVDENGSLQAVQSVTDHLEQRDGFGVQHIATDPSGRYLLAACPTLDTLLVYAINSETGKLTYLDSQHAATPAGLCILNLKG